MIEISSLHCAAISTARLSATRSIIAASWLARRYILMTAIIQSRRSFVAMVTVDEQLAPTSALDLDLSESKRTGFRGKQWKFWSQLSETKS